MNYGPKNFSVFFLSAHLVALLLCWSLPALNATAQQTPKGTEVLVQNAQEIAAALSSALPGDTLVMMDGVWENQQILFDGKQSSNGVGGTDTLPITLRAETPGEVILTGNSTLRMTGSYMVVDGLKFEGGALPGGQHILQFRNGSSNLADHCRLTNTAFIDYNPLNPATNYKWVSVYGLDNRVDHCVFSGMNHKGVTLTVWPTVNGPANNTHIHHNLFRDHAEGTGNGFETIRIGTSTVSQQDSNALVEENLFLRCDGEIEIISSKSVGNRYLHNTFRECKGQLTLRHGAACHVEGNFFFGDGKEGSSGVRIIGPDQVVVNNYFEGLRGTGSRAGLVMMNGVPNSPLNRYIQVENALVAFNTFVNCEETFAIGRESSVGDTTLPPKDSVIANNLVLTNADSIITYYNTPTNFAYEGNIFFGAPLGIPDPGGINQTDPLLEMGADSLYRPMALSPSIDGATGSYPSITVDMDGHGRPTIATEKDVGSDEVGPSPVVYAPLTQEEVGPDWFDPTQMGEIPSLVSHWVLY